LGWSGFGLTTFHDVFPCNVYKAAASSLVCPQMLFPQQ